MELTEEAIRIAREYWPQRVIAKVKNKGNIYVDGRVLVGFFGRDRLMVFDGDIVQLGNKKYADSNREYYQMRWDPVKFWWTAHIIQSENNPHWVTLPFDAALSITTGKPYTFTNIYRVVDIDLY